ncbi:thiaminase II [Oceanobacillus piezotolerans]|uniref:Aminopyrimidine aminohydrolase n=1 Tax=Oceanobacillus piezotolerans TaxID=2448030 RepID=A0A498D4Z4_9BACI|nr:thiaminase II [Oceanobacillus piezotolerans]RLL42021.1 thiaminase II [Oceanobacillus piezotolerans]
MSFTNQLRKENDHIFQLIFDHPFVDGIGKGDVSKEAIAHYIKADFEYLNAFMQIYGIGLSKSSKREDIAYFFQRIQFILNDEVHPHHTFCHYIGVNYEDLQGYPLPPTADHYIKHMMYHAQTGTMGETLGALLPCPWTYLEIGQVLMERYQPTEENPFYEWIRFYGDPSVEASTMEMRNRLDALAASASTEEKDKIREAFQKSCELELAFWEMSYTCEEWPSKGLVKKL